MHRFLLLCFFLDLIAQLLDSDDSLALSSRDLTMGVKKLVISSSVSALQAHTGMKLNKGLYVRKFC